MGGSGREKVRRNRNKRKEGSGEDESNKITNRKLEEMRKESDKGRNGRKEAREIEKREEERK